MTGDLVGVCVAYTPPSVRSVPWLFDVNGVPALGRLIARVASFFGRTACCVLNADPFRDAVVRAIARDQGVDTFSTGSRSLQHVLLDFCAARPGLGSLILLTDAAIVPDCVESQAMLGAHRAADADVTLPDDALLDGVLPAIVKAASVSTVFARLPHASDLMALRTALRQQAPSAGFSVRPYSMRDRLDGAALGQLPALAAVCDRWTQEAAAYATATCPGMHDARPARAFKERLLALHDAVPPCTLPPKRAGTRRVLYSSLRTAFSGGEQSLWTLIAHLDVTRYAPAAVLPFESLLADRLRGAGVETEVAGWDYSEPTARNLRFCEQLLERVRPDILHVDAQPNPALMVTAFLRGIPIVGHLRIIPKDAVSPFTYLPARIITVSDVVAARLRRFNIPPDRVVVIHNAASSPFPAAGSSSTGWLRQELRIPAGACVFLVVSRISPMKQLEVAGDALAEVAGDPREIYLLVAGEPSAKFGLYAQDDVLYAERLKTRVEERGLAARVRWLGFDGTIDRLYDEIDCVIMCNPDEPFGRSGIEAFAHGVPVIGADAGGAIEIVTDGVDGLLFEAGSAGDLAAAMLRVAHDEEYRRMLGGNARRSAWRFRVDRHVAAVEAVYDAVLAPSRAAPRHARSGTPS